MLCHEWSGSSCLNQQPRKCMSPSPATLMLVRNHTQPRSLSPPCSGSTQKRRDNCPLKGHRQGLAHPQPLIFPGLFLHPLPGAPTPLRALIPHSNRRQTAPKGCPDPAVTRLTWSPQHRRKRAAFACSRVIFQRHFGLFHPVQEKTDKGP